MAMRLCHVTQIKHKEMSVGAAVNQLQPPPLQCLAQGLGVGHDLAL